MTKNLMIKLYYILQLHDRNNKESA